MRRSTYAEFRQLCREHKLAATHQRQKIYEALVSRLGHYSPEEVYDRVKQDLPSISLATVYKNLKTFVQAGMLRDVSRHHGPWRVDANIVPHHHLVCTQCHSITDLDFDRIEPVKLKGRLPSGFRIEKFNVEVQGVCKACGAVPGKQHSFISQEITSNVRSRREVPRLQRYRNRKPRKGEGIQDHQQ